MSGVVGKLDASYQHAVVVGLDGAARLFVHDAMVGHGPGSGKVLKAVAVSPAATATAATATAAKAAKATYAGRDGHQAANLYEFFVSTDSAEGDPSATDVSGRPSTAPARATTTTTASGASAKTSHRRTVSGAKTTSSRSQVSGGGSVSSATSGSIGPETGGRASQKHRNAIGQSVTRRVKWQSHSFVTGNHTGLPPRFLGKDVDHEMLNVPLFELATLTPKERQVNRMKLEAFLHTNGTLRATVDVGIVA